MVANKLNTLFPLVKTFNPKRANAISTTKPNLVKVKGSNKQTHKGADRLANKSIQMEKLRINISKQQKYCQKASKSTKSAVFTIQ